MPPKIFEPKDRTRTEHLARVSCVKWSDPDSQRVILALADGGSAVGPGTAEQFSTKGQQFRFMGRWADGKFGPEFQFVASVLDVAHTEGAVTKYLSDTCRNIGKATAARLWVAYGPDAVRQLREEPEVVAKDEIMNLPSAQEAAADLAKFARIEKTKVDLFGLLGGRGFGSRVIDRAIATWGVKAPDVIRRDPFALLVRGLPGCGWKRCDKFYTDLRKNPAAMKRQALAAWAAIRDDRTGSTWLDARDVANAVMGTIPRADPYKALILLRRAGWVRVRRDGASRFVTLRERATAEQRIADNIRRLTTRSPSLWPARLLTSQVDGDGLPSAHQAEQWARATAAAVGCFTGGPGTGKTHTLAFALRQLVAEHGPHSVAVVAPTGKAAQRATDSLRSLGLNIRATTIHRLLEIGRNGHDGGGWGFQRNRNRPLDVRFILPDEASMVDVPLMADLLDAVPDGGQVLFVGDPYQLPPVGHGAPLRDLLAAGAAQGELTEVRRNAGSIVRACVAIKAGSPVEFPERLDFDAADPLNLRFLDCEPAETVELLGDVLQNMTKFDRAWETQIITALNDKSDVSRAKINERFGKILNPDGREAKGNRFRTGDKIICQRNTELKVMEPIATRFGNPAMALDAGYYQDAGDNPVYVANGEIGRVVAVSEKLTVARFGGVDSPLVAIANKKRPANTEAGQGGDDDSGDGTGSKDDFDLAWAITVHKSQGSEWPLVIVLVDDAGSQICDRSWWYTAVSRGRKGTVVIGPRGVFDRQVKRQAITQRRTFLPELLRGGAS